MRADCKGKCKSPLFMLTYKARATRHPVYAHDRERYCNECEIAYPGAILTFCKCCGRKLKTKPKNRKIVLSLHG